MKKRHIKLLESFIDDFDLSELETDLIRELIKTVHLTENSAKADHRKMTMLRIQYPDVYKNIMDMYDEKYGRVYGESNGQD